MELTKIVNDLFIVLEFQDLNDNYIPFIYCWNTEGINLSNKRISTSMDCYICYKKDGNSNYLNCHNEFNQKRILKLFFDEKYYCLKDLKMHDELFKKYNLCYNISDDKKFVSVWHI